MDELREELRELERENTHLRQIIGEGWWFIGRRSGATAG